MSSREHTNNDWVNMLNHDLSEYHVCKPYSWSYNISTWQYYELAYRAARHHHETVHAMAYAGILGAYKSARYPESLVAKEEFRHQLPEETLEDKIQEYCLRLVDNVSEKKDRSFVEALMLMYGLGIFLKVWWPETSDELLTAVHTLKRELMLVKVPYPEDPKELDLRELLEDFNYYYLRPCLESEFSRGYIEWPFLRPLVFICPSTVRSGTYSYINSMYPDHDDLEYE